MNCEFLIYRSFPDGREGLLHEAAGLICEYESGAMEEVLAGGVHGRPGEGPAGRRIKPRHA